MTINILEYIENSAYNYPHKLAVVDENIGYTYADLKEIVYRIGSYLSVNIDVLRKPIVVYMEKSPECLAAFWGIVVSGNFYVCIDSSMAQERISKIITVLNPAAIIIKRDKPFPVDTLCPIIYYEEASKASIEILRLNSIRNSCIDTDPLYVLYTSGSTGIPKGSVITHKSVIAYTEWIVETFNFDEQTVLGSQTPFCFSMSVFDIYSCIKCGGTLQIIPKKLFSFPVDLLKFLKNKRINTIYWVPSALCIIANWKALDYVELPDLKKILFAGEVMPTKQLNIWRYHLPDALYANLFGPTEITDIALYYILNREFSDEEPIPIGIPCKNMNVFALSENGNEIKTDEIGELYFRGSFVGAGYYCQEDKTLTAFVQNPLNHAYPEVVYRTGDLVRKNEYGEYLYIGRVDSQIKHMGYRIELGEIEAVVSAHEQVNACVCIYNGSQDRILLFYTGTIQDVDLRVYLTQHLPQYMIPSDIISLLAMPLNINGKIDRQLLYEQYV